MFSPAIPFQLKYIDPPRSYPNYKLKPAVYFSVKILHSLIMENKILLVITGINSVPSKKTMKTDGLITLIA